MPRSSTSKLTQNAVIVILLAAALTWLAQPLAPERGATGPNLPAPPAPPPPFDTPAPEPAPGETPVPAAPSRDAAEPGAADSNLVDAEPAGPVPSAPAKPAGTTPWRVIDPDAYSLTPVTIPLYVHLPGTYEWPLPNVDRLELICIHDPGAPSHLSIMQAADGHLYHWSEERHFLRKHLDASGIDSRDIRTVADPGGFMEPLRAAAHAACERSLQAVDTPDGK